MLLYKQRNMSVSEILPMSSFYKNWLVFILILNKLDVILIVKGQQ